MKMMFAKKALGLLLAGAMTLGLAACGNTAAGNAGGNAAEPAAVESSAGGDSAVPGKPFKIGVLVADATSAEALGRRNYLENYIAKAYNMEFVYSDELADSAGEKSAIDTMITNNANIICSMV